MDDRLRHVQSEQFTRRYSAASTLRYRRWRVTDSVEWRSRRSATGAQAAHDGNRRVRHAERSTNLVSRLTCR